MATGSGRVLSIQSHVAFGYVGGKAAAFPLQCLGWDVDIVNTVNFSNHAGYGRSGGTKTSAAELESIFSAMEFNELLDPERLLTGYIPNAEALTAVKKFTEKLREQKPELVYLLDPVMGDAGRLYVSEDVVPVYRSMLPLSTMITPNWFEVEILTQIPLVSLPSVREALIKLHKEFRVPYVAISSIPLKDWLEEALPEDIRPSSTSASGSWLLCITSECDISELKSNGEVTSIVHAQCVPFLPGYFSGVGDLFSALVLAHYHPKPPSSSFSPDFGTPFSSAVSHALSKTHSVLLNTYHYSEGLPEDERLATDDEKDEKDPIRKVRRMRGRELRLIQSADVIRANLDETEKEGQVEGNKRKKKGGVEVEMRRLVKWNEFWGSS